MWLEQQSPGVWVSPRRMWLPTPGTMPLSACGTRCAPIVANETCAPPACPGNGTVVTVASDLATVSDFPQDYGGYTHEIEALRADPTLAGLHGYLADHPDLSRQIEAQRLHDEAIQRETHRQEESVRWVSEYRHRDRLELGLSAMFSFLDSDGTMFAGGTATAAYVYLQEADDANDDDGDAALFDFLLGDEFGAELRVHFQYSIDGAQSGEWMTLVGIGPAITNRLKTSVVRLPSFIGAGLPELGLALRADHQPTWYVGWRFPVSILLDQDVAMDAALSLFVIDDWLPEVMNEDGTMSDPAEVIFSISAGFRLP